MSPVFGPEEIREYWTKQAHEHGLEPAASWSDRHAIELEIRQLLPRLADDDQVLDIGCANGYTAVRLAAERAVRVKGIDYLPAMIEQARRRLEELPGRLRGTVEFAVGDARALDEPDERYDKVVVVRTIINLGEWDAQLGGLHECARVLRPHGTLLLSEPTIQGWRRLNQFRREWQLDDLPMPPFNNYLDEQVVIDSLRDQLELVELVEFSSTYFVGTRVLKPLLIRALGLKLDVADPDMEWNRWFSQLPAVGDYGTQKLFVLRKK